MLLPTKRETDEIAALLEQGADSPVDLAKAVIRRLGELREERTQWVSILEATPGVYFGYGMWPTKDAAKKALPKIPMAQFSTRGAFVPVKGMAAIDAAYAQVDEPLADRGDAFEIALDVQAFRNGWKGRVSERHKFLPAGT